MQLPLMQPADATSCTIGPIDVDRSTIEYPVLFFLVSLTAHRPDPLKWSGRNLTTFDLASNEVPKAIVEAYMDQRTPGYETRQGSQWPDLSEMTDAFLTSSLRLTEMNC